MFGNDKKFRPCLVRGQKALFHKFVETNKIMLRITEPNIMSIQENKRQEVHQRIMEDGIIPGWMEVVKVKNLAALVEFADGSVKLVEIDGLEFVDDIFYDYSFGELHDGDGNFVDVLRKLKDESIRSL